jgi:hypothetical protein
VTVILLVVLPLVVVLYVLIAGINHGDHYAPQAYYRRKRGGAPVAYGFESLAPRHRRRLPDSPAEGEDPPGG